jgi:hypothetical protein
LIARAANRDTGKQLRLKQRYTSHKATIAVAFFMPFNPCDLLSAL